MWSGPTAADVDSFLGLGRAFGLADDAAVRDELSGVLTRLDGSTHHALLYGDPCPGNDLHTVDDVPVATYPATSPTPAWVG